MIRYIPKEQIKRLNSIAVKNKKQSLTDDCPILNEQWNIPITMSFPGIDTTGWVRCMLPSGPDCEQQILLDLRLKDYCKLPTHPQEVERQTSV